MKTNLLFLILLFLANTALAQGVYSWKDENGVTQFGDSRQSPQAKVVEIGKLNSVGAQEVDVSTNPTTEKKRQPDIVMYSAAWCGVCKKAKAYFSKNNVAFTEYDVDTSTKGKQFQAKRKSKSVPLFLIDGKERSGFSANSFNKLLSLK